MDQAVEFFASFLNQTKSVNYHDSFLNSTYEFISVINWKQDIWISILLLIHLILFLFVFLNRNNHNLQFIILIFITILILNSENLNTLLSKNHESFSSQNYFDKSGIFIGIFLSGPLILISLFIIVYTLKVVAQLLVTVKKNQIKQEMKKKE
jgi:transmembrane protein 18